MTAKILKLASLFLVLPFLFPVSALATTVSSSSHYSVDQVFFGAGGASETDPTNGDTAQADVGDLGTCSNSSDSPSDITPDCNSSNYEAYAGFNTTSDPYLEFVVTAEDITTSSPILNVADTSIANANFYVRAWQAGSYVVQTASAPPASDEGYELHNLSTPTASTPGTEQFGMNLVHDTSPSALSSTSANPVQTTGFPYCSPASNYDISNEYTYNQGDAVINCGYSTSATYYTISYIYNIADSTPSGIYNFDQVLVATATY